MMRPLPSITDCTMRRSIGSRRAGRDPAVRNTRATVAAADPSPGPAVRDHPLPASRGEGPRVMLSESEASRSRDPSRCSG